MNKSNQVNRRQLFSLGTLVLMVPALRHFVTASARYAGRAAWLTPLIAALPMLLYLHFMADFLGRRREGENLQELMLRCLGPRLGKVALGLTAAWLLLYSGFVLRSGADRMIITIYPNSAPGPFIIATGLVCLVAALGKPRSLIRCAQLVKPLVLAALLLILFFALFSAKSGNLLPITVNDALPAALGSLAAVNVLLVGVYTLGFVEGLVPLSPGRARESSLWLLWMVVLLCLLATALTGMFGAELTAKMNRPFFVMVRNLVFFRTVERVEALVSMLWMFPDFLLASLQLWSAQYCLRLLFGFHGVCTGEKLTDLRRGRWILFLCALAMLGSALLIGRDAQEMAFWSSRLMPVLNLGYALLFLPGVYITGRLKKTL